MWLANWAVARYDLGLSEQEFYSITPRQLDALAKRKEYETRHTELLFAQLTSYLINFSTVRPKEPVKPADFMPSEWAKEKPQPKRVRITAAKRRELTLQWRSGLMALAQRNKHA